MDHCFLMSFKGDRLVFLVHNEPGLKEEVFKLLFFLKHQYDFTFRRRLTFRSELSQYDVYIQRYH